ncbi:hypothetical protein [Helicobacter rodentium]|nr:hypothetical protein [Helicobacter rodentium]
MQILTMTEWDSSFAPLLSHNKAESIGQSGYYWICCIVDCCDSIL